MVMGVFDSHLTHIETETTKGEHDWLKVTHWGTPMPRQSIPRLVPPLPPISIQALCFYGCGAF